MNVYRFRSIEALLGEYQELESQTIYFASPDQLNDPMEGLRDIVWRGDKVVWTNFFKNYVYCLNASYPLHRTIFDSIELDVDKLPIEGCWNRLLTPQGQRFDSVWYRFHNLPKVRQMIEALANTNRKIRYRELEYYLRLIQQIIVVLIISLGFAHQFVPEFTKQQLTAEISNVVEESLEFILIALVLFEKAKTDEKINTFLREKEELLNNERINRQLENPGSEGRLEDMDQLFFDFPKKYMKAIERLLWPNWYTACFMKDYRSSSVWGHYGDKHEGACLIFETEIVDGLHNLSLYEVKMTDKGEKRSIITKRPFREVRYSVKPGEIDFFRSIGRSTGDELKKLWYTDDEGNESECGDHLQSDGATFDWQESYWDRFYRDITTKTKDWEYEKEYRLILEDMLGEYDEGESRTITYVFHSLKGIIFGIKASDEDKLRIMEIIQRRCRETDREDFEYYQAYYSPEDGNIQKYRIPLPPLDGTAISDRQAS